MRALLLAAVILGGCTPTRRNASRTPDLFRFHHKTGGTGTDRSCLANAARTAASFGRLAVLGSALGSCTAHLGSGTALNLGFDGRVSHRANAPAPRGYVGLRLYVTRHP